MTRPRLTAERLEDRTTPATFVDGGAILTLDLNMASETVAVVSNGTTYGLTLTGGTWGGTDSANVTGNGTAGLTVTSAGIAAFTTAVRITDSAAGTSVAFIDSGANGYANSFDVVLDGGSSGVTFSGATAFGVSSLSAQTDRGIAFTSGAAVSTSSGTLTLTANQQVTPTAGNFVGVDVNNATVQSTTTGVVSVTGRGGNDAGGSQYGVQVRNAGVISGGTTGGLTVDGRGGPSAGSFNYGVFITGTNSRITSAGGSVAVTGLGGGTGAAAFNHGVFVFLGGVVTASGSGTVTVDGTGGATTGNSNFGVIVTGAGATVTSAGGSVSVTGQGGGGGGSGFNYGALVENGGTVTSGAAGKVTVTGQGGGSSGNSNFGVFVTGAGATVTSAGGNVTVTGKGGGSGAGDAHGVHIDTGGAITAGASGTVTVSGTGGGAGGNFHYGVFVTDANSRITSTGGAIDVTGQGGGTGAGKFNHGVLVFGGGAITAVGSGSVTLDGKGGVGAGGSNFGVCVDGAGAAVRSVNGNVSVNGLGGGAGTGGFNHGVLINNGGTVSASGSGGISVDGIGGTDAGGFNFGVQVFGSNTSITSAGGAITVTGQGGGGGAGGNNAGVMVQSGGTIIGGTGAVTVDGTGGAATGGTNAGVFVIGAGSAITSTGGAVSVTGAGGGTGAGFQNYGIHLESGGTIAAGGSGPVTVDGTGGATTGGNNYGVEASGTGATITSAGAVTVTGRGGGTAGSGTNYGVFLQFAGVISGGSVSVDGTGGGVGGPGNGSLNAGVFVIGVGSSITSGTGPLTVTGVGGGTGAGFQNYGVHLESGGNIAGGGPGAVSVTGTGGSTAGGNNYGVEASGTGAAITSGGAVTVTGRGGGTAGSGSNYGVFLQFAGVISGGAGALSVDGTGGSGGGGSNVGVFVTDAGSAITSSTGGITLGGTGGTGGAANRGVCLAAGGTVRSTGVGGGAALISITGVGGMGTNTNRGVDVSGTGSTVSSVDGDVSIAGTGGSGTGQFNEGVAVFSAGIIRSSGVGGGAAAITISGTGGSGTDGNRGVVLDGSGTAVTATDGAISVTGGGGTSTGVGNHGVVVGNGSVISSTGTGPDAATIVVTGTGGTGTSFNRGVSVEQGGATVTSVAGAIALLGTGGTASAQFNEGVYVGISAVVSSTGTGTGAATVTIVGTGGKGTDGNRGVAVELNSARISSVAGEIIIIGTGGSATGGGNVGVWMSGGGLVQSTGTGPGAAAITITGIGGTGSGFARGVDVEGAGTQVRTVDGAIVITGAGGSSSGSFNEGVFVNSGAVVISSGTGAAAGAITVDGTGGTGGDDNRGVNIEQPGSALQSTDGDISVTGTAGSGLGSRGVLLFAGGQVRSTGSGLGAARISITGTGQDVGVDVISAISSVVTQDGDIFVSGTATAGTGFDVTSGSVIAVGAGTLSVTGESLSGTGIGVLLTGGTLTAASISLAVSEATGTDIQIVNTLLTAGPGDLLLTADSIALGGTTKLGGSGALTIRPLTNTTTIGLGGGIGGLNLTDAELTTLSGGFASIAIGRVGGTGAVTVETAAFADSVIFVGSGPVSDATDAGTDVTADGLVLGSSISPRSTSAGVFSVAGGLTFVAGASLTIQLDGPVPGTGYDQVAVVGTVDLGGATLSLSGSFIPALGGQFRIVDNDGSDAIAGTFAGLPEGAGMMVNGRAFRLSYAGGDGNDMVLTRINILPTANPDTSTTAEDSQTTLDPRANDFDADGDTLTVVAVTQGAHGAVTFTPTGVTYTPAGDYNGPDSFTYTVSDGNGGTAGATVSVTVTPLNDPPSANLDALVLPEDGPATAADVLANDSIAPDAGESLTVIAVTQGAHGAVTLVGGVVRYTPAADYNGPDSFTYTVSDGNGGTATATVTVRVVPVNDPPTAADDAATVTEDAPATAIEVLANDSAAPDVGEALTITAVAQPTHGSVVITGGGTGLTYRPTPDFFGTDTFTYTVSDGTSAVTRTVAVTVTPVNDPPVAADDAFTVAAGRATVLPVLANDSTGPDAGETLTVVSVTQPAASGMVALTPGGLTFTPAPGFAGAATFAYTVSDGQGGTDAATVTVTVRPQAVPFLVGGPTDGSVRVLTGTSGFALGAPIAALPGLGVNARTAVADVNGDGVPDYVVGAGPGSLPRVVVLDGTDERVVVQFSAFEDTFAGGVFVAAADIDGDGFAEVVVTPDESGGPVVAVYRGSQLAAGVGGQAAQLTRFFGIAGDPNFRGGCRSALGDANGDGAADLVVSAGVLGGPRIALFDGQSLRAGSPDPSRLVGDFFAFEDTLRNGAFVAAGDVNGDGRADVAFGGGPGGAPRVRLFDGAALVAAPGFSNVDAVAGAAQRANFFAGDTSLRGGVRLALHDADADGRADLATGSGAGEPSRVRVYEAATLLGGGTAADQEIDPFGAALANGVFVG